MKEEKTNNNHFERDLKKAADGLQVQPSDSVWDNIKKEIPTKKRPVYMMRWVAAAAVLLAIVGLGWYFLHSTEANETNMTQPKIVDAETPSNKKANNLSNKKVDKKEVKTAEHNNISDNAGSSQVDESEPNYAGNNAKFPVESIGNGNKNGGVIPSKPSASSEKQLQSASVNKVSKIIPLKGKVAYRTTIQEFTPGFLQYPENTIERIKKRIALSKKKVSDDQSGITFAAFFSSGVSYRKLKKAPVAENRMSGMSQSAPVFQLVGGQRTSAPEVQHDIKSLQQSPDWGWDAGVRMGVSLPKNWLLKTGISLQKTGYKMTAFRQKGLNRMNDVAFLRTTAAPSNTNALRFTGAAYVPEEKESVTLRNQYFKAELPVLIGHRFGRPDNISFTVMAGAGLTYLLNANAIEYDANLERYLTNRNENKYIEPFNGSLLLETAMNLPLSKNINFSFGPTLQYQMFSSYKSDNPVTEFPYLIGLKTAIKFK